MTNISNTPNFLNAITSLSDPNTSGQWYFDRDKLSDLSIEVESVWLDYTGAGVTVAVMDSIVDAGHLDLVHAYDDSLDIDLATGETDISWETSEAQHFHGTAVAGVIAAGRDNDHGSVGVAYGVTLTNFAMDFSVSNVDEMTQSGLRNAAQVDVLNASWSYTTAFSDTILPGSDVYEAMTTGIIEGRDGLGTVIVFAGGNSAGSASSNYYGHQNSPFTIAVGAVSADGNAAVFSSLGSNLLLSAAGEDIISSSAYRGTVDHYSGTSFSAPMVSAAAALMLEANPDLGYRDVMDILALSARADELGTDARGGLGWVTNAAGNFNGGGMHYSDSYGYGYLNVHAAVRLAETWQEQNTFENLTIEKYTQKPSDVTLTAGEQDRVAIDFDFDQDITMESAQLLVRLPWSHSNDIEMYLTSPQGTVSQLMYDMEQTNGGGSFAAFPFTTNALVGESSLGTWTLEIINTNPDAQFNNGSGPMTGDVKQLDLTVYGSEPDNDDTYFYNDEYANGYYSDSDQIARAVLSDVNGGIDSLNAAMVTASVRVDLSGATESLIGTQSLTLQADEIENAFTGDGDDMLIGSTANNALYAGRGNDSLIATEGEDYLDGGDGNDVLIFEAASGSINEITQHDSGVVSFSWGNTITSTVNVFSIESFHFSDVELTLGELVAVTPTPPESDEEEVPVVDPDPVPTPTEPAEGELVRATSAGETIFGLSGNDTIYGGGGTDSISGGGGDDRIVGNTENDTLQGDAGNDTLIGNDGENLLIGGDGDDRLVASGDNDVLFGGEGNDTLVATGLTHQLEGGDGTDRLVLGDGVDEIVLRAQHEGQDTIVNFDAEQDSILLDLGGGIIDDLFWNETSGGTSFGIEVNGEVSDLAYIVGADQADVETALILL